MPSQPLVSILINNYNYARFLSDSIDSALAQSYADTEVIVVDDGSTDESHDLIRSYGSRIRPIFQSNQGQASAMNRGVEESRGDILCFLDADDSFYPGKVAAVVEELSARGAGDEPRLMIGHRMDHVTGDGTATGGRTISLRTSTRAAAIRELSENGWFSSRPIPSSAISITRAVAGRIFPLPASGVRVCSDVFVFNGAHLVGDVVGISQSLGAYRIHGENRFYRRLDDPRTRRHYEVLNEYVEGIVAREDVGVDCFESLYASPYFLSHASRRESLRYVLRLLRSGIDRRTILVVNLQLLRIAGILPVMRKLKRLMEQSR